MLGNLPGIQELLLTPFLDRLRFLGHYKLALIDVGEASSGMINDQCPRSQLRTKPDIVRTLLTSIKCSVHAEVSIAAHLRHLLGDRREEPVTASLRCSKLTCNLCSILCDSFGDITGIALTKCSDTREGLPWLDHAGYDSRGCCLSIR